MGVKISGENPTIWVIYVMSSIM